MSVDFPRAWEIARQTPEDEHGLLCSYRQTRGAVLCDCRVLTEHEEFKDGGLHTTGGVPWDIRRAEELRD